MLKKIIKKIWDRIPFVHYPYKPFMYKHKCIFIHIPKNAGTSVLRAFGDEGHRKHAKWQDFYESNANLFDQSIKFAIVREPLARLHSAYRYVLKGGNGTPSDLLLRDEVADKSVDFESFILNVLDHDFLMIQILFLPQYLFVYDRHYQSKVDMILKYENLQNDWQDLMNQLKLDLQLPWVNKGEEIRFDGVLSDEAIEKVRLLYHLDYRYFNYD